MSQSPQNAMYRPQMSPMNVISSFEYTKAFFSLEMEANLDYANSPNPPMMDEEIQFLMKFFSDRLPYLVRLINRCQQEGALSPHFLSQINELSLSLPQVKQSE